MSLFESTPFLPLGGGLAFAHTPPLFTVTRDFTTGRVSTRGTQTNKITFPDEIEVSEFARPEPFEEAAKKEGGYVKSGKGRPSSSIAPESETPVLNLGSVKEATKSALDFMAIRTRNDLDALGGPTESGLYDKVKGYTVPSLWDSIKDPKASVRASYERMLEGYKIYQ